MKMDVDKTLNEIRSSLDAFEVVVANFSGDSKIEVKLQNKKTLKY